MNKDMQNFIAKLLNARDSSLIFFTKENMLEAYQSQPLTVTTISSISQISICSTDEWRATSRKTPPSPPPMTKTYKINTESI